MNDPRIDRLASVLCGYSTRVSTGDLVRIAAPTDAYPLVRAVYACCVAAGAHPFWAVRDEGLDEELLERASDEQLAFLSPLETHAIETIDVHLTLWAESNTRRFTRFDPARQVARNAARKPILERFMARVAAEEMRWCGTQFPTEAAAQDAERSLRQYEDFVYGAGMLDREDPVAAWQDLYERQEHVRERMQQASEVRFRSPANDVHDGTDLTVNVDGGTWVNCHGDQNFPDGEVFCGPQGADGHVNYTFPACHGGRIVEGVRLEFRDGRVVDASAVRNEAFLIESLEQDEGARNMGEIAIGTNYSITEFTRNTLFDEKIGGTFHAAVGAGYPESGNTNESALHWDMVCDLRPDPNAPGGSRGAGTIEADGELISKGGRFVDPAWPAP